MGRVGGLFDFAANFEVQYGEPLDSRTVVQKLSDLTSTESWQSTDENVYTYVGMRVSVVNDGANNGVYWLRVPDYTNLDNWESLSAESGNRTFPFTDTDVVVIPDVESLPLVETYVKIEGEQLVYGNSLYGDSFYGGAFEHTFESVIGVKYKYSPRTNELRVILPEAVSGVVVLKS